MAGPRFSGKELDARIAEIVRRRSVQVSPEHLEIAPVAPPAQKRIHCANCFWFEHDSCHRYPPVMVPSPLHGSIAAWPKMREHDWCGEGLERT